MEVAIFDTTIWIDLSKNVESRETDLLLEYVANYPSQIYLTPTIIQEILQGVKTKKDFEYRLNVLSSFNCFKDDWIKTSVLAAQLFFDLRKKGVTIRKSTDCLIAQIAIQNDALLVHNDRDFEQIAKHNNLKTLSS